MVKNLDGVLFKELISYGIKNLKLHETIVNDMNVFPVPDGDTGTNMTMTLMNGYEAIRNEEGSLSDLASKFGYAVAFGARGNSGVISSQFFKGFSESFVNTHNADANLFVEALEKGVAEAYLSVSKPTEGTILTVVREATEHVRQQLDEGKLRSVNEVIDAFLHKAEASLKNTPELLPVLKSSGVVDSGGAGILYFFQGMKKYIMHEEIEMQEVEAPAAPAIDYSAFNRQTKFEFGYCTEVLLQLIDGKAEFDYEAFKNTLETLGDSVATVYADEKVKVHVHTMQPEQVLGFCHQYGEFLNMKIENMSVQHTQKQEAEEPKEEVFPHSPWAVVAVASDTMLEETFKQIGARAVIQGGQLCNPSVQDFLAVFQKVNADHIIVFPNNKNVILTALQAKKLYANGKVTVIHSTSMAECYAALGLVDYDSEKPEDVVQVIHEAIERIDTISISQAVRDTVYDQVNIETGDYVAIERSHIVGADKTLEGVVIPMIDKYLAEEEKDVVTFFAGQNIAEQELEELLSYVEENYYYVDCGVVQTDSTVYSLILSFE